MKVVELLKIGAELLKRMSETDVKRDDYKYVDAYEHYLHMRSLGIKHRECVRIVAKENKVSQRTLERIFERLRRNC